MTDEENGAIVEAEQDEARKRRRGAPSKFKPEFIEQAEKLAKLGATDMEIADFFGVAKWTLNRWKHEHPGFVEALTVGKGVADEKVVRSLFQRAIGYMIETEKVFCNAKGEVTRVATIEHIQPSDTAAIFWLKNRMGWRDKIDHEHSGKDGGAIQHQATVEAVMKMLPQVQDEC